MARIFVLLLVGCTPDPGADPKPADAYDAPWEGLAADDIATGQCLAYVNATEQGAGWFVTGNGELWGTEGCWVRLTSPAAASDDVMVVTFAGRDGADAWYTLEIDVTGRVWNATDIAIDGTDAAGIVQRRAADGTVTPAAYFVGGTLEVTDAGREDGDDIALTFSDAPIATVPE
jgi:hypothetical protein